MNYLLCMLLIGITMAFFLRVLSLFERGAWPSEEAHSFGNALRELILGRRVS